MDQQFACSRHRCLGCGGCVHDLLLERLEGLPACHIENVAQEGRGVVRALGGEPVELASPDLEVFAYPLGSAPVAQRPERQLGKRRQLPGGERGVALLGEVVDDELEGRQVAGERPPWPGAFEQVLQAPRPRPAGVPLVHDDAEDRRQRAPFGFLALQPAPDAGHLVQHAQGHPVVGGALVLEQEEDVALCPLEPGAEERIGEPLTEALVHVVARERLQ